MSACTDTASCTCNSMEHKDIDTVLRNFNDCKWTKHKDIDAISCTVPSIAANGRSKKTLTLSFVPSTTASGLLPRDILTSCRLKAWTVGKWRDTIHRYEIDQGCWNSNDVYIIQSHK